MQVRANKGEVIVPAVPENQIGFRFGPRNDLGIVDTCVDQVAQFQVWLIFFPFLDRALSGVEVRATGEALYRLTFEISLGHGVTYNSYPKAFLLQQT